MCCYGRRAFTSDVIFDTVEAAAQQQVGLYKFMFTTPRVSSSPASINTT